MSEDQTFSSPLSIQNIPLFVRQELSERQGKSSISSSGVGVFGFNPTPAGSQQHPKMVWTRVTSNYGDGFVFASSNETLGFRNTYNTSGNADTIIGYDATPQKNPIRIENDQFKNRPIPGIESIENDSAEGESRNFRVSTIKWVCWSKSQLDKLTPYLLNPGVSIIIEYGWSKGAAGLNTIDIANVNDLVKMAEDAAFMYKKIEANKGNYDVSFGFITNYTIEPRMDGGYNCVTTIKHPGGIYSGLAALSNTKSTDPVDSLAKRNDTLATFLKDSFDKLPSAAAEYHKGRLVDYPVNEVFYGRKSDLYSPKIRGGNVKSPAVATNPNLVLSVGQAFDVNRQVKQQPPPVESDFVEPYNGDFDNSDDWWMSLNHFFYWINTVVAKDNLLYQFDIDKSVVSAHINLKSVDGQVLLVPNTRSPEKFLTNETDRRLTALNKEISKLTETIIRLENIERESFLRTQREIGALFTGNVPTQTRSPARDPGTIRAPRGQEPQAEQPLFVQRQNLAALEKRRDDILKNYSPSYEDGESFMQSFVDAGGVSKASRVVRSDLNKIINWWDTDRNARAFPAIEVDDEIQDPIEKGRVGYLKNLYVHHKVVKDSLNNGKDVKQIVMEVLEKINQAAGNIWSFEIVPLTSVGTSKLTIIDRNCIHKTGISSFNELYDFSYLSTDGILNKVIFSVKSADSQTTNTIFESMRADGSNLTMSQYKFPFAIDSDPKPKNRDRIFNSVNFKPDPNQKTQDEEDTRKKLEEKRKSFDTKPTNDYTYTTSKSNAGESIYVTLVEPDADFMKSTIYGSSSAGQGLAAGIVQPGLTLEIVLQGISGWRTLQCFKMTQLLEPYGSRCVFQIKNVKHVVQNGKWETALECAVRLKSALFDEKVQP